MEFLHNKKGNNMDKMVDGVIVALTDAEIDIINSDRAAFIQNRLADLVRLDRNKLLAGTDYLALSDNTMSAAMTTYRQALRDITEQAGFPTSVTWPTKP